MGNQNKVDLREIFIKKIRSHFYVLLAAGPLKDLKYEQTINIVDSIMIKSRGEINAYIKSENVTLLSMNKHAETIVEKILLPRLSEMRVE